MPADTDSRPTDGILQLYENGYWLLIGPDGHYRCSPELEKHLRRGPHRCRPGRTLVAGRVCESLRVEERPGEGPSAGLGSLSGLVRMDEELLGLQRCSEKPMPQIIQVKLELPKDWRHFRLPPCAARSPPGTAGPPGS